MQGMKSLKTGRVRAWLGVRAMAIGPIAALLIVSPASPLLGSQEVDRHIQKLLAQVAGVATQVHRASGEPSQALNSRIQSMADVHSLLSRNRWQGVNLAELLRQSLSKHASDANASIGGPVVKLSAHAAQTLAMVFHELVTNAAKYGALSSPHGRVEVSWRDGTGEGDPTLSIVWREIRGPKIAAAPADGYGVGLIRDLIPRELGGRVDLDFAVDGLCCKFDIPLAALREGHAGEHGKPGMQSAS